MAEQYPDRVQHLAERRPALKMVGQGREALETALDAERRQLIRRQRGTPGQVHGSGETLGGGLAHSRSGNAGIEPVRGPSPHGATGGGIASFHRARGRAMTELRDEFLSEEDLDLQSLTDEELDAVWTAWLRSAEHQ